ncbi:hypothetical protein PsYK624_004030 [Phanerochaete sordida]|uniref:Uncharacterized protein n=1 Tax=Phanerochaete sordida TaxID=48140 RepID=A0A9P3L851_9APHY|nr:hypothetical protein PsYK624_004030 [Phanerochaete sordida]
MFAPVVAVLLLLQVCVLRAGVLAAPTPITRDADPVSPFFKFKPQTAGALALPPHRPVAAAGFADPQDPPPLSTGAASDPSATPAASDAAQSASQAASSSVVASSAPASSSSDSSSAASSSSALGHVKCEQRSSLVHSLEHQHFELKQHPFEHLGFFFLFFLLFHFLFYFLFLGFDLVQHGVRLAVLGDCRCAEHRFVLCTIECIITHCLFGIIGIGIIISVFNTLHICICICICFVVVGDTVLHLQCYHIIRCVSQRVIIFLVIVRDCAHVDLLVVLRHCSVLLDLFGRVSVIHLLLVGPSCVSDRCTKQLVGCLCFLCERLCCHFVGSLSTPFQHRVVKLLELFSEPLQQLCYLAFQLNCRLVV